eukprot:9744057-Alexandrium_andersonii.AAC.1
MKVKAERDPTEQVLMQDLESNSFDIICKQIQHDVDATLVFLSKTKNYEKMRYWKKLESQQRHLTTCQRAAEAFVES